jgi:hypothetical protein
MSGLRWVLGKGVTVPEVSNKHRLTALIKADVCEMEDYWIGNMAGARGIPFLAVRVIYDEWGEALPDYKNLVDPRGNVRAFRAMTHFMAHPAWLIKSGIKYHRAKKSLSDFVTGFLEAGEPKR